METHYIITRRCAVTTPRGFVLFEEGQSIHFYAWTDETKTGALLSLVPIEDMDPECEPFEVVRWDKAPAILKSLYRASR